MKGLHRPWLPMVLLLLLAEGCVGITCAAADAASDVFAPRAGDEIWLVSTRDAGCVDEDSWSEARYKSGNWVERSDQQLKDGAEGAGGKAAATVVYVHGNRMDAAGAESRGLAVYRELFSTSDCGKVRFIIWSWPSDQIHGPIKDVRAKAARSDDEAFLLARFLKEIPAGQQVGLIGFSYGARIVGGAMQLLGGGPLVGRKVAAGERANFRVVFWAAGVQNDWLLAENVHGQALPLGKRWLNIYTRCDSVLWRFYKVDRCDGSPALGYTGLAGKSTLPGDLAERYEDWDVTDLISSEHRSEPYFFSSDIIRRTRESILEKEE